MLNADELDFLNFNSHAHVERDMAKMCKSALKGISTHTLTWSVTPLAPLQPRHNKISTHTLTWSVTITVIAFRTITLISTHTLTWSVTRFRVRKVRAGHISTHTLTWSVTQKIILQTKN